VTREQDGAKAAELEAWLDMVAASYNVLPMDAAAFREWGRLTHRKSDTLLEDAVIAATARPASCTAQRPPRSIPRRRPKTRHGL
jgi:predicted nucleic acid-binding protein